MPEVGPACSPGSAALPADPQGAVLDGRDIGTVVCPGASVKLFITASSEERARRRHRELVGRGESATFATILADIEARDARDASRSAAPLRMADDAIRLDTTELDADAAFAEARASWSRAAATRIEGGLRIVHVPYVDPPGPLTYCGRAVPDGPPRSARDASA